MRSKIQKIVFAICFTFAFQTWISAQDWPQWRGENRDAIAAGFDAPETWPKELVKKWSVEVGDGVASPSIQGDKVYVIAFQDGNEVMRCLDANTGEEIWSDKYPAKPASGPARGFPGTRASPTVADGKVVTLGVNGTVSCWDANSGELAWRNDEHKGQVPRFSTSSSPLITDGHCIVQFGGERSGGIAAYDLASGDEKWKWTGDGTAYGSPILLTVDGTIVILAPTARRLVALELPTGNELWDMAYTQGRYNAATPVAADQSILVAGPNRGITAISFSKDGDKLTGDEKWRNDDSNVSALYNSPVLLDGMLYGLSTANNLFCVNAKTGETVWNNPISGASSGGQASNQQKQRGGDRKQGDAKGGRRGGQGGAGRGRGRGGRRGGGRGYGSVVSAGPVLMGLTPAAELVIYEPSSASFKELARYKVADGQTYAYPVPLGNRIYIKDKNSLTMWTLN